MNLADIIAAHAASRPGETALFDGERAFSYRDFDRIARQGAAHLRSLGVKPGDEIGLCLRDDADHILAFFSTARLGAAVVPIDWRAPPAERARIVRALGLKLVLVAPGLGAQIESRTTVVDAAWYAAAERADASGAFPGDPDVPLMIGLTSGTTGAVKGMVVTHRQMHARTLPVDEILPPGHHRYLSASPLAFSAGRNYCFAHLVRGDTVILHPALFTAEEYVEVANRTGATAGFVVPTVLRTLLELNPAPPPLLPGMRALLYGGAPAHPEEKRAALARVTPNLYEMYGTVATGPISSLTPANMAAHAESDGRPARSWTLEVVDEADRPLPTGSIGRLRLRGPALAAGLHGGAAAATSEAFRDGWYYTGDLVSLDAEGFLYVKGRVSDMILRGGSNVYPDEVEAVLAQHTAVAAAGVVGRPSPKLGEEIVAFVVRRDPVEAGTLLAHCRTRLAAYKTPAEIRFVDELPRTTFGKVDRKALALLAKSQ